MNLYDVYSLFPINVVRGEGFNVWDDKGVKYLDLYGGHAVISIGHSHPHYVECVGRQLSTLGFYSNSVINRLQETLAERIGSISGYTDYALFMINSGAEANENALKLASFHTGRSRVISFKRAFHGRTSLAVEVTDIPSIVAPINANNHVEYIALGDVDTLRRELSKGDVAAVIIEGIQGVGGIRMASKEFMQELRSLCSQYGTVLILDEIQSGYGRSGKFFAHQYYDIKPDLITVAKGIANGFPCAALLISPMFHAIKGQLGTTFGGNHLACAAALAVLDVIESEHLIENAAKVGEYLLNELKALPQVKEVRGRGLMIGIEMERPIKELRQRLLFDKHIFTGVSGENVIRLLPPLTIGVEEADEFLSAFTSLSGQLPTSFYPAE